MPPMDLSIAKWEHILMPQHVVVRDYNPDYPSMFEAEKKLLAPIFADNLVSFYHIGSTTVVGLKAKPIIDIMPVVHSLSGADSARGALEALGYEYLGEFGIAGRRYLRKGGDERTHQIHIFRADDTLNLERHLAFRDYLRAHEDTREEYARLKKALAEKFPRDIDGYCEGKDSFVRRVQALALSCYDGSWNRLYLAARAVQGKRTLSATVEAGSVAAALLTQKGNVYTGVCIDTACSLGMCAERAAVAAMVTHGESAIEKLAAVMPDGSVGMPCGACRELLAQLGDDAGDIRILRDLDTGESVTLRSLLPSWWRERK